MSKFNWRNGFAVGLFVGVSATILVDLALETYPDEKSSPDSHGNEYDNIGPQDNRWWLIGRVVHMDDTAAQWLITLLTILAVGLIYLTLRDTRRMALDTTRMGETQTQAYVHAEKAEFLWGGRAEINPQIMIWINNVGQTPARWFQIRAFPVVFAHPLDPDDTGGFPVDFPSEESLGAFSNKWKNPSKSQDGETIRIELEKYGVTKEDLKGTRGRGSTHGLAIFGEVKYSTLFGQTFVSQFVFGRHWFDKYEAAETRKVMDEGVSTNKNREKPQSMSSFSFDLLTYHECDKD